MKRIEIIQKQWLAVLLVLLILFGFSGCFYKHYEKVEGFQILDFRGNYCYYIANDYFIFNDSGDCWLEYINKDHDKDVTIYEGKFVRFSKINQNYVAVENRYEADGKEFDEYALVYLPDTFRQLQDAKIQREYDFKNFQKLLDKKQLKIEKWEEA